MTLGNAKDAAKATSKVVVKKIPSPTILKHNSQLEKLQQKAALESVVQEEIRNFLKQKAALERECATAVQKLILQHTSKKEFVAYCDILQGTGTGSPAQPSADSNDSPNRPQESLTLAQLWKACLADLLIQQALKIRACDDITKVAKELKDEEIKSAKVTKAQQVKQALELAVGIQSEINKVVDLVTCSKKGYHDAEKVVEETRQKITKIEQKSKKRPSAAKVPEKITEALQAEETGATAARNEYLLSIAGANSRLARYYTHDLPYVIDMMNGNMYEVIKNALAAGFAAELKIIPEIHESYNKILGQINQLSSRKDIESVISANPMLNDPVQFNFEACAGDPVSTVSTAGDAGHAMDKCARKWAMHLLENDAKQTKLEQQMEQLSSQTSEITTTEGRAAMDSKVYSIRESLRYTATFHHKAEAILNVLKQGGVDVGKWMENARIAIDQKLIASPGPEIISTLPPNPLKHRKPSVAAPDVGQDNSIDLRAASGEVSNGDDRSLQRCVVLYDYAAGRDDELSVSVDQELFIVDGSTDGEWILVEDSNGTQGYVPGNYVQTLDTSSAEPDGGWEPNEITEDPWNNNQTNIWQSDISAGWNENSEEISPYNPKYSNDLSRTNSASTTGGNESAAFPNSEYLDRQRNDSISLMALAHDDSVTKGAEYCRAIGDYPAEDPEDLSFREGDVIRIISRSSGDVDDGYWTGELNGKIGLFLAVLTEDFVMEGDMSISSEIGTSVSSTPSPLPAVGNHVFHTPYETVPHLPPRPRHAFP